MTRKGQISRDRIVEAANRLFYTHGYNQTSFADVASAVGITKGNLHYHFKSKDELLQAVIDYRLGLIGGQLEQWDRQFPAAKDRLKRFVQMLLNEAGDLVRYGCPMGSLNVELGKCQLPQRDRARQMFDLYRDWLEQVFKQLDGKDGEARSTHLLAMAQGAALLSYVYADVKLLEQECARIDEWIDAL